MRIAVAADHQGYWLKEHLKETLAGAGHEVVDLGPDGSESVDYPRLAAPAARQVGQGDADAGVFICGSGVGVAIVANRCTESGRSMLTIPTRPPRRGATTTPTC